MYGVGRDAEDKASHGDKKPEKPAPEKQKEQTDKEKRQRVMKVRMKH